MGEGPKRARAAALATSGIRKKRKVDTSMANEVPLVSTDNFDVVVTWDIAQEILATFAKAGLNNLGKDSIRLNARNSGTPNDTPEAKEWATKPPFAYLKPVGPDDFAGQQSPVTLSEQVINGQHLQLHGSPGVAVNWNQEYRMLALVLVRAHSVVIPFDKMIGVTSDHAEFFAQQKLKEYNENNVES